MSSDHLETTERYLQEYQEGLLTQDDLVKCLVNVVHEQHAQLHELELYTQLRKHTPMYRAPAFDQDDAHFAVAFMDDSKNILMLVDPDCGWTHDAMLEHEPNIRWNTDSPTFVLLQQQPAIESGCDSCSEIKPHEHLQLQEVTPDMVARYSSQDGLYVLVISGVDACGQIDTSYRLLHS